MLERFTERARKVVVLAQEEARRLRHKYIGTEHILLGLVRESEGVAPRVLSILDVDPDKVRREVARMLGAEPDALDLVESAMEPGVAGNQTLFRGRIRSLQVSVRVGGRPRTLLVDLDYSYSAGETGKRPEAMNHDEVLELVAEVLEGREYPSVEAGVLEAGRLVLDRFPPVHEVEISAVREHLLERRAASGITVSRTFRR